MARPIVPAIIPQSFDDVKKLCERLSFSLELHLDVVDGQFVPFTSWPYSPSGDPLEVHEFTDRFTLEVDLMVARPLMAADAWVKAGADMLVFHTETISVEECKRFKEQHKVTISICAGNDVSDAVLYEYLPFVDGVQVMGIPHVGTQGLPFDERSLARISKLKQDWPKLPISVDGSVNADTIKRLAATDADRFIVGSAIATAVDPAVAHFELVRALN